jgi:hypothetical protein
MSTNAGIVSDALKYVTQKTTDKHNTKDRRTNRGSRRRNNYKRRF